MEELEISLSRLGLEDNDRYFVDIVAKLRNKENDKEKCIKEKDTLRKCLLCKYFLSSNEWSIIIEKHVKELFQIEKPVNSTSGDGCSKSKDNIEIKVSLGTKDGQFHFVQIRPDHDIKYYIFIAYDVSKDVFGKVYWFLCESEKLYELLPQYGSYAHGTVAKLGKIAKDNIKGRNCEYALRPSPYKKGIPNALWNILIDKFLSSEEVIHNTIALSHDG